MGIIDNNEDKGKLINRKRNFWKARM